MGLIRTFRCLSFNTPSSMLQPSRGLELNYLPNWKGDLRENCSLGKGTTGVARSTHSMNLSILLVQRLTLGILLKEVSLSGILETHPETTCGFGSWFWERVESGMRAKNASFVCYICWQDLCSYILVYLPKCILVYLSSSLSYRHHLLPGYKHAGATSRDALGTVCYVHFEPEHGGFCCIAKANHKEKVSCDSMGLFSVVVTGKSTFGMLSR